MVTDPGRRRRGPLRRWIAAGFVLAIAAVPSAQAAPSFSNPFVEAQAMRLDRGSPPTASVRLRFQYESSPPLAASETVTIDVAADWALVHRGPATQLFDYRLDRLLIIDSPGRSFTSLGLGHMVWFLAAERQNRMVLAGAMASAFPDREGVDGCDAEAELGISIPALGDDVKASAAASGDAVVVNCNGRVVGRFEVGEGSPLPAAFWPTMALTMPTPPLLREAIVRSGRAPRSIEVSFRLDGGEIATRSWRLLSEEEIAEPYPLPADYANVTAAGLDDAMVGLGALASAAVAGSVDGGAPSKEEWDANLRSMSEKEGIAAATLAISPTISMFPELPSECQAGARWFACDVLRGLKEVYRSDFAVRAFFDIVTAEQSGEVGVALDAMERARASDEFENPVLGAAFALALLRGGAPIQEQARARDLPVDPARLQRAAVEAYPYNPSYWTDIGDGFLRAFRMAEALLLYEVAASLPIDGVKHGHPAVESRRDVVDRLHGDFPYYFME